MKKLITTLGILFLVGAVAVPVMAWGPGWGRGHMMGWGYDSDDDYAAVTSEQKSKLEKLDSTFYEETRGLKDQLRTKSGELDTLLNTTDPDLQKAKALQKEISTIRTQLDEKTLAYELEARKIVPDQRSYATRGGYPYHMGPYGGARGHCWD